ncbi:MAG: ABC transporter permease [Candidatus Aminicenantes bacterium]|nr:MAG: ABC transporter permease [Candidatus Aminicenantes bacterium]
MFKNYVITALRTIKRHKGYSFINVFGLAIGMVCCILILLWVQNELSYDRFHANSDDIHRVIKQEYTEGETQWSALTSPPLAQPLKEDFAEIIRSTRYGNWGTRVVQYQDTRVNEEKFEHADPDFFKIFSFDFIAGSPDSAFSDPHSVVLTKETAQRYFGTEDPIGKTLTVETIYDVKVTGVIQNIPENSTLQFDFLSPFALLKEFIGENNMQNWHFNSFMTFVQLAQNADEQGVNRGIADYINRLTDEEVYKLALQPFKKIHLSSHILHDFSGVGDKKYVYIFSALALFVLFIACINFMNLATARSSKRALEVGIRKVSGAKRADLVKQFFGEAIFLSFISLIFAVFLVELLLPLFNRLAGKNLDLDFTGNVSVYLGLLAITVISGILSGVYPALFLSSFQPARVLKGTLRAGARGGLFRKILVVTQFSLSVFLIIATMIIFKQLDYIRSIDMGYDREHIIHMSMVGDSNEKYETLKQELQKGLNILAVSASFALPTKNFNSPGSPDWEGRPEDKEIYMNVDFVDFDYFETLGIEVAEGRTFSKDFATDAEEAYIVNEELVRQMGMEEPLGKRFAFWEEWGTIVGVAKNFHFQSLHNKINPISFRLNPSWMRFVYVRIKPDDIPATVVFLRNTWNRIVPDYPFEYHFLDESFEGLYKAEQQMGAITNSFTVLGIFIACLGLFGLAAFMAERRTKEIGIRKVLGASVPKLMYLLSSEFTKWVLVANIIAWPVAYLVAHRWLQNFAYRTNIHIGMFLLAAALSFFIALATVSFKALKTATANPAKALRYE